MNVLRMASTQDACTELFLQEVNSIWEFSQHRWLPGKYVNAKKLELPKDTVGKANALEALVSAGRQTDSWTVE